MTIDRAYLKGIADNYLEALVAHDPSRLPLAPDVKFTENTIKLELGEALWRTASDLTDYRLYVCDPRTSQVGVFAYMKENGFPIITSLRVKIEHETITEIETIVAREGQMPIPEENMKKVKQLYLDPLKPEEKVSREEMLRISDLYFQALIRNDDSLVPIYPECNRVENGLQTTNNPDLFPTPEGGSPVPLDCAGQINANNFAYITDINPRRWTVVDEERGLTFGTFMFHHTGTVKSATLPDGTVREMIPWAQRPFTVPVSELFKVQNGRIREIEAVMTELPYGAGSGWD